MSRLHFPQASKLAYALRKSYFSRRSVQAVLVALSRLGAILCCSYTATGGYIGTSPKECVDEVGWCMIIGAYVRILSLFLRGKISIIDCGCRFKSWNLGEYITPLWPRADWVAALTVAADYYSKFNQSMIQWFHYSIDQSINIDTFIGRKNSSHRPFNLYRV